MDNLEPLLNVQLHIQRSEYRSHSFFVDAAVRPITKPFSNLYHMIKWNLSLL